MGIAPDTTRTSAKKQLPAMIGLPRIKEFESSETLDEFCVAARLVHVTPVSGSIGATERALAHLQSERVSAER